MPTNARHAVTLLLGVWLASETIARAEAGNLIQEIVYQNANHISQKDLEEITHLRKGLPLDAEHVREARWRIEDDLKERGRFFAHVSILEGTNPGDRRIVFNITEGPVVRVRKTLFVGNQTVSADRLRIEANGTFWPVLCGRININMATFDRDVQRIEKYYKANGYLDARVTRELAFTPDLRLVDVIFHIVEGSRYRVERVDIEGCNRFRKEDLCRCIRLKERDYYGERIVDSDIRRITGYYGWCGLVVKVTGDHVYSQEPGLVRIRYHLEEKTPRHIGSIWFPIDEANVMRSHTQPTR